MRPHRSASSRAVITPAATVAFSLVAAMVAQSALAASLSDRPGYYGELAPAAAAVRTIQLDHGSRWINVTQSETVRIQRGDQAFTWTFSTWTTNSFDLARIAPSGFVAPGAVHVYLQADPRYSGQ